MEHMNAEMALYTAAAPQSMASCPTCATLGRVARRALMRRPCQPLSWKTSPPAMRSPSLPGCASLCARYAPAPESLPGSKKACLRWDDLAKAHVQRVA